ncbi:phospholipase A and acyltransferase 2-like [Sceloporus undulatus]|uniref:phospholipase A and acyltransferase 2-like n=1 Tax=Sceloporus undulatus TaxID=8520 RepID=UPI001C4B6A41|nr:phospholipase A and acyltransferase 2-like [Sceloporus undulatus]
MKGTKPYMDVQKMFAPVVNVITSNQTPNLGDMIQFQRVGYQHWGIYVGNGRVIHFTLPDWGETWRRVFAGEPQTATVQFDRLEDVAGTLPYAVCNQFDAEQPPLSPDDIVRRAQSLVGLQLPYDLMRSNCEHFATMMRYGTPQDGQAGWFRFTVNPEFARQIRQRLRERGLLRTVPRPRLTGCPPRTVTRYNRHDEL